MAKKVRFILVRLLAVAALASCGEPDETCTCSCTCGSGEKSTIDGTDDEEDCSNQCDTKCGADSYTTNYDCTTKG
ncbi:MAG TPA: hypothetical protein VF103_10395 [Polyangiaceae bacterium]